VPATQRREFGSEKSGAQRSVGERYPTRWYLTVGGVSKTVRHEVGVASGARATRKAVGGRVPRRVGYPTGCWEMPVEYEGECRMAYALGVGTDPKGGRAVSREHTDKGKASNPEVRSGSPALEKGDEESIERILRYVTSMKRTGGID